MKCACPTCQAVLQLPQPAPERVRCPKCSTVIAVRAPAAAPTPQTIRRAPAAAPPAPALDFGADEPAYRRRSPK
jgi:hypothetical protein